MPRTQQLEQYVRQVGASAGFTNPDVSVCVSCNHPNLNFRDQLSKDEYELSHLCQKCQDDVFGKEE